MTTDELLTETSLTAPCYAVFPDGSDVLVAYIRKGGKARVCNEDGDWWVESIENLRPAPEGWTW